MLTTCDSSGTLSRRPQWSVIRPPLTNDMADFPLDRIDMSVALFGCEQSAETGISRITPLTEDLRRRSLWGRGENSTISGILLFQRLRPGGMRHADVCLYENPWSRYPVSHWLTNTLPHAYVEEKQGIQYLCWPSDQRLSSLLNISTQIHDPSRNVRSNPASCHYRMNRLGIWQSRRRALACRRARASKSARRHCGVRVS